MIELLGLGRQHGYQRLEQAVEGALKMDCKDAAAVRYLITAETLKRGHAPLAEVPALARYDRPLPVMDEYDRLVGAEVQPCQEVRTRRSHYPSVLQDAAYPGHCRAF